MNEHVAADEMGGHVRLRQARARSRRRLFDEAADGVAGGGGRSSSGPASASSSASSLAAPPKRARVPASLSQTIRLTAAHQVGGELFEWEGPLPSVPFAGPPDALIRAAACVGEVERFVLLGLMLCADSLLYGFGFLPIKVVIAAVALLRAGLRRVASGRHVSLYPRQQLVLAQGVTVALSVMALDALDLDLEDTYARVNRSKGYARLHAVFLLFSAFDALITVLGQRATGYLSWGITNRRHRAPLLAVYAGTVLLHCVILNVQVSTLMSGVDGGTEMIGLLFGIKLTAGDVRSGVEQKRQSTQQISDGLVRDVVERFKWCVFLGVVLAAKLSPPAAPDESPAPVDMAPVLKYLALTYFSVVAVDTLRHGFYALLHHRDVTPDTYRRIRARFTRCLTTAPKVGFGDSHSAQRMPSQFASSFNFVLLPFLTLLVRSAKRLRGPARGLPGPLWLALFILGACAAKIVLRLLLRGYARRVHWSRRTLADAARAVVRKSRGGRPSPPPPPPRMRRTNSLSLFSIMRQLASPESAGQLVMSDPDESEMGAAAVAGPDDQQGEEKEQQQQQEEPHGTASSGGEANDQGVYLEWLRRELQRQAEAAAVSEASSESESEDNGSEQEQNE